jgi:hypothetical protein
MAEGTKYPYVTGTDKMVSFFKKIPDVGVPDKFQLKNLKSMGYTSSADERFLPALKFIQFLDSSGVPSPLWKEARASMGPAMAKGLRAGYSDLFHQYPNAHQKDDEALRTFFSVHSGTGKDAVARMVSTFKALCTLADFTADVQDADQEDEVEKPTPGKSTRAQKQLPEAVGGLPVSINIQLQLPPDATGEIYERFFAAMAKHLPIK